MVYGAVVIVVLSLAPDVWARQIEPGPIRASLEREAARFASLPRQAPAPVATPSDSRIRLTLKQPYAPQVIGVIERVDAETLTLIPDGRQSMTVTLTDIARVEREVGKGSRGRQAFFGTLIGMVAGYTVSKVVYNACGQSSGLCELGNIPHRFYSISAGGVSGGLIGAFAISTQRWKTVTLSEVAAGVK